MSLSVEKYSFAKLVETLKIQIPILQRDYVQGRNTEEVKEIRRNFVSDLVHHIVSQGNQVLPLDFIYGYADNELGRYDREVAQNNLESLLVKIKEFSTSENFELSYSIADQKKAESDIFIPLDGQQRLTTLFLLHFYVLLKYKPEEIKTKLEDKLLYKTRRSSEKFIKNLIVHAVELAHFDNISHKIEDSTWFVSSWKHDPTVDGILVMLQAIQDEFDKIDINDKFSVAYKNLFTLPSAIQFDFLDMGKYSISEDIYLKMNASGKALSDYDNFKSWFVSQVKSLINKEQIETSIGILYNWQNHLDQNWYNLFWGLEQNHTDKLIYQFFRWVFSFSILANEENNDTTEKKFIRLNDGSFIPLYIYNDYHLVTLGNTKLLFGVLSELSKENNEKVGLINELWGEEFSNDQLYTNLLLKSKEKLTLLHQTFLYVTMVLIVRCVGGENEEFRKWIRIFRNLIYNTRIDDFSRFVLAIKAIDKFFNGKQRLDTSQEFNIDFFDSKQIYEENEKIKLENEFGHECVVLFEKAENHFYLYGQIFFLIKWSKNNGDFNLRTFSNYLQRFSLLFSKEHLHDKNFIIQCVFLAEDYNWMLDKGSNRRSFCKNTFTSSRERNENWRVVFNDENSIIKQFLDNFLYSTEDLESFIEKKKADVVDWRRYFLDDPSLIGQCGERLMNRSDEGNYIRLLSKSKLSGFHKELRTFVLYKLLKLKEVNVKYCSVDSGGDSCRIHLLNENIYVRFDRTTKEFLLEQKRDDVRGNSIYDLVPYCVLSDELQEAISNFRLFIIS